MRACLLKENKTRTMNPESSPIHDAAAVFAELDARMDAAHDADDHDLAFRMIQRKTVWKFFVDGYQNNHLEKSLIIVMALRKNRKDLFRRISEILGVTGDWWVCGSRLPVAVEVPADDVVRAVRQAVLE
jgi:hypothetical protein